MLGQRLRRSLRVGPAATNPRHGTVGLNHIPLPTEQKRLFLVGNQ